MEAPKILPEGALVLLKSGGPLMTTEKMDKQQQLVPVVWFSSDGMCQRDVFHIDALVIVGMPCKPDHDTMMEIAKQAMEDRRQAEEDILNASCE